MPPAVSPLMNASYDGLVQVTELGPLGMITLRGDLSNAALVKAATAVAGVKMPGLRGASCNGDHGILWMSPDEVLVLCPHAEVATAVATLGAALQGQHALVADVSDARAVFALKGAMTREVLAKLTPADMSPEGLPVGELRRTRLAQVAAALWLRDKDEAQVICFRSVADYAFGVLKSAAHPASGVGFF
ncbi:sarcosine oxidase subunit gamma family protein [Tropicibacter oceani]|uniref:Sarcosine oxidase subunit gamma family protein n=2 Tax=Tropicibacter oceani TaxID=3058420 RepID=A0ABY8QNY3_9RHOB|nr:sarcosine oxidase subunit gamma family protein [Tropicibacter oceani]